jgi:hypothetical protein
MVTTQQPCLFLQLPRELRDAVYSFVVDYPDMTQLLEQHVDRTKASFVNRFGPDVSIDRIEELLPWSALIHPQPTPLRTPSIFLVNRQVSVEALEMLHTKTLHIEDPIPANYNREIRDTSLTDFIGEETLSSIRHASLRISFKTTKLANAWYRTINQLTEIWRANNRLQSLKVFVEPMYVISGQESEVESAKRIRKHTVSNVGNRQSVVIRTCTNNAQLKKLAGNVPITFHGAFQGSLSSKGAMWGY